MVLNPEVVVYRIPKTFGEGCDFSGSRYVRSVTDFDSQVFVPSNVILLRSFDWRWEHAIFFIDGEVQSFVVDRRLCHCLT